MYKCTRAEKYFASTTCKQYVGRQTLYLFIIVSTTNQAKYKIISKTRLSTVIYGTNTKELDTRYGNIQCQPSTSCRNKSQAFSGASLAGIRSALLFFSMPSIIHHSHPGKFPLLSSSYLPSRPIY